MRRASTYFQLASRAGLAQTHRPCPLFITAARILLRPLGQSLQSGVLIRSRALLSNDFDVNCSQQTAQRWRAGTLSKELTDADGNKITVNMDVVCYMKWIRDMTTVYFRDSDAVRVKETPNEILMLRAL